MKKTITVGALLAAMAGAAIAGGGQGTINGIGNGGGGSVNGMLNGIANGWIGNGGMPNGPSGAAPAYAIDGVAAHNGRLVFGGR